jgi:hypothetical protein
MRRKLGYKNYLKHEKRIENGTQITQMLRNADLRGFFLYSSFTVLNQVQI